MVPADNISRPYASIYPRQYIAIRAPLSLTSSINQPAIDGNLDKLFWNEVDWSEEFVDIATDTKPKFTTKFKIRWDDEFLYVGKPILVCDISLSVVSLFITYTYIYTLT